MNFSAPARAKLICWYQSCSAHCFRRTGSLCARFAFCANFVFGRLIVFFSSSAGASVDMVLQVIKRRIVTAWMLAHQQPHGRVRSPRVSKRQPHHPNSQQCIEPSLTVGLLTQKARTMFSGETMVRAVSKPFDVFRS